MKRWNSPHINMWVFYTHKFHFNLMYIVFITLLLEMHVELCFSVVCGSQVRWYFPKNAIHSTQRKGCLRLTLDESLMADPYKASETAFFKSIF